MKGQTQPASKSVVFRKLFGWVGSRGPTRYVLGPRFQKADQRASLDDSPDKTMAGKTKRMRVALPSMETRRAGVFAHAVRIDRQLLDEVESSGRILPSWKRRTPPHFRGGVDLVGG